MGSVADRMVAHIEQRIDEQGKAASDNGNSSNKGNSVVLDMKRIFQGLSLDSIANCAFGINTDSFENPQNELFQVDKFFFFGIR